MTPPTTAPTFTDWLANEGRHSTCDYVRALATVVRAHGLGVVTWQLSTQPSHHLVRAVRRARREYNAWTDHVHGRARVVRPPVG